MANAADQCRQARNVTMPMRRATNTVNYGKTLPLAQGVKFDVA
jgi:hypothetical protein